LFYGPRLVKNPKSSTAKLAAAPYREAAVTDSTAHSAYQLLRKEAAPNQQALAAEANKNQQQSAFKTLRFDREDNTEAPSTHSNPIKRQVQVL
jgi:hypothetical protein